MAVPWFNEPPCLLDTFTAEELASISGIKAKTLEDDFLLRVALFNRSGNIINGWKLYRWYVSVSEASKYKPIGQ